MRDLGNHYFFSFFPYSFFVYLSLKEHPAKLHSGVCLFNREFGRGLLKESSLCMLAMTGDWDWRRPANTAV